MTKEEALFKLLALEPETRPRLIAVTGWDAEETESTLDKLVKDGKVTYRNGSHGAFGERRYYPKPATKSHAGLLPAASGASRERVRNPCGGLVREAGALAFGWPRPTNSQGSGEEAN